MPDGALNITLSDVVLSSTSVLSGTILHAIIGDPTLSALISVLSNAMLESQLDGSTLSSDTSVIAEASLSATIGSVSGQAFSVVRDGSTAPYEDVLSWTGHPLTGSRVRVRTGNLFGIFGELNEFGIFAGEGWDENSGTIPAWDSKYIRLGSFTNEFHNIPVKLYDDGDVTIQLEPDAPSFAMGNPIPSTYGTGIGLWQGKDSDDVYKWRVGDPSVGGSMLSWNGSSLSLVNSSLDIGGATAHIAFGNPPPTSPTSGTGIWIDRTGFYGVNAGVAQIFIDTLDGILYVDGGTEFGVNPLLGDLYVDGILTLGTDGRLQQGTGTWGVDFTGSAIWNESGVMNIGGWNNNIKQWWGGSDGKFYAGGGYVIIDDIGISIVNPSPGIGAQPFRFIDSNNDQFFSISGASILGHTEGQMILENPPEESLNSYTEFSIIAKNTVNVASFSRLDLQAFDDGGKIINTNANFTAPNIMVSQNLVVEGTIKDGSDIAYLKSTEKAADSDKLDGKTLAQVMLSIYPVGAIYMSSASTNPGTLFGGTWEAYGQGRVLVGKATSGTFATAGSTGGAETHSHGLSAGFAKILGSTDGWIGLARKAVSTWTMTHKNNATNNDTLGTTSVAAELGGTTDSDSTLQPYIVVYMWRRTA